MTMVDHSPRWQCVDDVHSATKNNYDWLDDRWRLGWTIRYQTTRFCPLVRNQIRRQPLIQHYWRNLTHRERHPIDVVAIPYCVHQEIIRGYDVDFVGSAAERLDEGEVVATVHLLDSAAFAGLGSY